MTIKRRRFKQSQSLRKRLEAFASDARAKASALQPGAERDALLKSARQADTASHIDDWISSAGLKAPT